MSSAPYAQRISRPVGWWGMAVFVATEATIFGSLIGTYFHLRFRTSPWPPHGIPDPKVLLPVVLTCILVATSIPMQLAFVAARRGQLVPARIALFVALLVQAGYLAMQLHLFIDDLDKFSPSATAYASIYFTLLGAHHAHVFVGVVLTAWILIRLLTRATVYRLVGLQSIVFYWHFVNALALVVTLVQIFPSL
jgi:heme/copper-type cytochrome/quinol oxidase subunit 3